MSEYKLEVRQLVDFPRCRIYRQFIRMLHRKRDIRMGTHAGFFHYALLGSYANFRTSYKCIEGISYIIHPGEWICTLAELAPEASVPECLSGVSNSHIHFLLQKIEKVLAAQGFLCCSCPNLQYKLLPLSSECIESIISPSLSPKRCFTRFLLTVSCQGSKELYRFEITLEKGDCL